MGVQVSTTPRNGDLSPEDVARLVRETNFKDRDIVLLANKYKQLIGSDQSNRTITENAFIAQMNIANKKIGSLMYRMLDINGSGELDFQEFVAGLNAFLPQTPIDRRIEMCFRAYDTDGNDTISKKEVREIVELSLDGNRFLEMSDEALEQLIDDLFGEYDSHMKGTLSRQEFARMVRKAPGILEFLELDVASIKEEPRYATARQFKLPQVNVKI